MEEGGGQEEILVSARQRRDVEACVQRAGLLQPAAFDALGDTCEANAAHGMDFTRGKIPG